MTIHACLGDNIPDYLHTKEYFELLSSKQVPAYMKLG